MIIRIDWYVDCCNPSDQRLMSCVTLEVDMILSSKRPLITRFLKPLRRITCNVSTQLLYRETIPCIMGL
jgi:hypothetical protein